MSNISAIAGVDLSSKVSVAVAKKSLDVAKTQGAAAVQMIKDAAAIAPGGSSPSPKGLDIYG